MRRNMEERIPSYDGTDVRPDKTRRAIVRLARSIYRKTMEAYRQVNNNHNRAKRSVTFGASLVSLFYHNRFSSLNSLRIREWKVDWLHATKQKIKRWLTKRDCKPYYTFIYNFLKTKLTETKTNKNTFFLELTKNNCNLLSRSITSLFSEIVFAKSGRVRIFDDFWHSVKPFEAVEESLFEHYECAGLFSSDSSIAEEPSLGATPIRESGVRHETK